MNKGTETDQSVAKEENEEQEEVPKWMRYLPKRSFPKRHQDIPVVVSTNTEDVNNVNVPLSSIARQVRRRNTRVSVNIFSPMTTRAQNAAAKRKISEFGAKSCSIKSSGSTRLSQAAAATGQEQEMAGDGTDHDDDDVHHKKRQRAAREGIGDSTSTSRGRSAQPANMLEVSALFGMSTLH